MKYRYLAVLGLIFVFLLTNATACSNPLQKKTPESEQQSGDKEQPKDLERLISHLDELYEALSGMEKTLRTGSSDTGQEGQQEQTEKQEQGDQGQGGQEGGQGGGSAGPVQDKEVQGIEGPGGQEKKQGGGGQGGAGQGAQGGGDQQSSDLKSQEESGKEKLEKFWSDIKGTVEKLNAGWNSFEPKADEDNVGKEAISGFEEELNNLSTSVQAKDIMQSLTASNELQKYVGEFLLPYKETVPAELYDARYFYQKAYIEILNNSWETAKEEARSALDAWYKAANDVEKEEEQIAKKMEFSLEDFSEGIDTRDMAVVDTKLNVVKENFKAIEKLFKDKEKKKEEKEQQ